MAVIYKLKNNSGAQGTWGGVVIEDGDWYTVESGNIEVFRADIQVMQDVAAGDLIVGNETQDWTGDAVGGWNYFMGDTMPKSDLDGRKISVHPSYKPQVGGITTYAVWTGSGDEVDGNGDPLDNGVIGGGPILHLQMTTAMNEKHVDVKFHPDHGRVWLHEAYIRFGDAPEDQDCYLEGQILTEDVPLQQSVNLDLEIDGDWIKLAAGGPGTGTHGWSDASKISLIPRTYSKDGDWDYDGTNLTPNTGGTGGYKISQFGKVVHKFVNRIPVCGSNPYFSITSDETTELPANFYLRIVAKSVDGQNFTRAWHAAIILEIYRQRTYIP